MTLSMHIFASQAFHSTVDQLEDPQDKKYYNNLVKQNNITSLPKIVKKGNYYQMKLEGITMEFTKDMLNKSMVRVNKKLINLKKAKNTRHLIQLIQRAASGK